MIHVHVGKLDFHHAYGVTVAIGPWLEVGGIRWRREVVVVSVSAYACRLVLSRLLGSLYEPRR